MSTGVLNTPVTAGLSAAVDGLFAADLHPLGEDELLSTVREVERARRRLEAVEAGLIAEIDERNLPGKYVMPSTAAFLAGLLTLSPREAAARVQQARWLGPRITVTGERLPPLLSIAAGAREAGAITAQQVSVIIRTIDKLPTTLPVSEVTAAEGFLVEQAQQFDAATLTRIAQRLLDTLNPDGTLAGENQQHRRRYLSIVPTTDGMHRLTAELDAETTALATSVLHSLAAPQPADNGDRDDRTAGQRLHDAFRAVLKLALRSGSLPKSGGVPATLLITMTAHQFETHTGLAHTNFGQQLSVDQALRLADEASIAWIVHNSTGGILNYGTSRRLASRSQTLALIARDQGCTFPGCTSPPEWTEKHHITPWSRGGQTNLDNLCLLCDHHHDRIDSGGWHVIMQAGVPTFIPPAWLDPQQRPRRNHRIQRE